jgi:glutamyl-tRNA synthetase
MAQVRTRFSPSPTGSLHLGGAHTALFNWLFARHHQGVFLLRIEDTDKERSEERFTAEILESLTWLGLGWDGDIFRQSERLPLYHDYIERLLEAGAAYCCDCEPADLEARRQAALARGEKPRYNGACRDKGLKRGPYTAVRFKTPHTGVTHWQDQIKGPIAFENQELDDLVLLRADGVPTYNFAVVVDDLTMAVSHIIRGDDHIPNTPRQLLIYEALNATPPLMAHMPLMLGQDRSKLSKRHGALPILAYRERGFLAHTLINYLARLGWSHGDQEIFSLSELIRYFSLKHVGKAPGIFDEEKLLWLNGHYLKETPAPALAQTLRPPWASPPRTRFTWPRWSPPCRPGAKPWWRWPTRRASTSTTPNPTIPRPRGNFSSRRMPRYLPRLPAGSKPCRTWKKPASPKCSRTWPRPPTAKWCMWPNL